MLKVGDRVISKVGPGTIVDIETMFLFGVQSTCYKISIDDTGMTVIVPIELSSQWTIRGEK